MKDEIISNVYEISKNFKDPVSNFNYNQENNKFNVSHKEGVVNISIDIDSNFKNKYNDIVFDLKNKIQEIKNVLSVNITLTSEITSNKKKIDEKKFKINTKKIIAIASGKGGVGKSTFAVNYATALKQLGNKVGILDADIYGPSIPRMMGLQNKPELNDQKKLIPLEGFGIKCMSIGFLINEDTPAIWRGPMIIKVLEQMFNGVEWGELDYLIIDLPPGTGDAQLTLAQRSKLSGAIIISTPQDVALIDAIKGVKMFNKVNVPVIGIVENMSYFICNNCNERHEIFSSGSVKKEAEKLNTSYLGELPIDINLRINSDIGKPICISDPDSSICKLYLKIAKDVENKIH